VTLSRVVLSVRKRQELRSPLRKITDADTRIRYLIVLRAADGLGTGRIAVHLDRDPSTVRRTINRFVGFGEAGLIDRREDNGSSKVDDFFRRTLGHIPSLTPQDFVPRRPTWTHALLIAVAARLTGTRISSRSPGRNVKHYLAGALDAQTGRLVPWRGIARPVGCSSACWNDSCGRIRRRG
jgi:hypothetical protein